MRRLVFALFAVSGACTTGRQLPTEAPSRPVASPEDPAAERAAEVQDRINRLAAYCAKLYEEPEVAPLAGKLPLDLVAQDVSFQMLARNERPSDEERQAILALVDRRAKCHQRHEEVLGPIYGPPPYWLTRLREQNTAALAALYGGESTYAEFNRRLQDFASQSERDQAEEQRRYAEEQYRQQILAQQYAQTYAAQAQAREAARQSDLQERAERDRRYQAAMRNFNQAFQPKPVVNCTSNTYGTTTATRCQ